MSTPILVSLLLCDYVVEDVRSRNKSYIGCFNVIHCESLPATHARMFVVFSLTEVHGMPDLRVVIRDPQFNQLFMAQGPFHSDDPVMVNDLVIAIDGLRLEHEGLHSVDIMSGSELLGSRKFDVVVTAMEPPTDPRLGSGEPGGGL